MILGHSCALISVATMQKSGQGSAHLSAFAGPKHVQRHCTDVVCFMLFVIVWIAAIVVGFFGYSTGDPDRITHGYDFQGNACGVGSNSQFPFVYFPVPGLVHYSVCVQACPVSFNTATCAKTVQQSDTKGDIITCNQGPLPSGPQLVKCLRNFTNIALYGGSLASAGFCFLTYPTNDFFNRCLPLANATSVTLGSPPVPSVVLTDFNKVSTSAQLTFQFQSGEVVNGKYLIVACIALSMGFAIVYSFFLRFSTALVVWATIILSFFLLLGTGSLLLFKAGMLNSAFLTKEFPDYPTSSSVSYTSDQKKALEACGAISIALAIAELFVVCTYRGSISLAIKVIEEAARAFEALPGLLLLPFIQLALYAIGIFWFLFSFIYLASAGSFDPELGSFQISKTLGDLIALEAFVLIWSHSFVHACGQLSISGAVSEWYFDKTRGSGSVYAALQRALRFHVGTAAFGSLIVSFVEVLRCIVNFYINRTKRLNKDSAVFKLLSCCANCCMSVLERIAHFASEMAYIQTAMHGTSFCSSAATSFDLVSRNTTNIIALSGVSGAIMFIGKLFIAFGTTLASLFIFNGGKDLLANTQQFQSMPCLVVFLLSYVIASFFLGIFESCIDTIFQCFCEDSERHGGKNTDPSIQRLNGAAAISFGSSPYSVSAPKGTSSTAVPYGRMNDNDKQVFI